MQSILELIALYSVIVPAKELKMRKNLMKPIMNGREGGVMGWGW